MSSTDRPVPARHAVARLREQALAAATRPFMARGIKMKRCADCLLPPERCICPLRPQLSAGLSFCLLMHRLEPLKPTNTGRLIAECMTDTHAFVWSRTEPDPALLVLLQDPQWQPILVFPREYAAPEQSVYQRIVPIDGKRPLLIIIDATWNQARKMVRMSPWLQVLPLLHLQPERISRYQLRRSCQAEHLCTAEVAVACLELAGEVNAAGGLDDYFDTFNNAYHMARLNRPLKDTPAQQRLRALKSCAD